VFLPGHEECEFLFGSGTLQEWIAKALSYGPQLVVLKRAEQGAIAATKDGVIEAPPFAIEKVIDPIGAGDAFAAGFLSAWLDALPIPQCLARANILGALATQFQGDWEGLPTLTEVQQIEAGQSGISR
jgi:2-dehydro-3-deoxygluconokinase